MSDVKIDDLDKAFFQANTPEEQLQAARNQLRRLKDFDINAFSTISRTFTAWKSAGFALPASEGIGLLSHYLCELDSDLKRTELISRMWADRYQYSVGVNDLTQRFLNLKEIAKNYTSELGISSIKPSHSQLKEFYYSFSNLTKTFSDISKKGDRFEKHNLAAQFQIYETLLSFPENMYPPDQSWKLGNNPLRPLLLEIFEKNFVYFVEGNEEKLFSNLLIHCAKGDSQEARDAFVLKMAPIILEAVREMRREGRSYPDNTMKIITSAVDRQPLDVQEKLCLEFAPIISYDDYWIKKLENIEPDKYPTTLRKALRIWIREKINSWRNKKDEPVKESPVALEVPQEEEHFGFDPKEKTTQESICVYIDEEKGSLVVENTPTKRRLAQLKMDGISPLAVARSPIITETDNHLMRAVLIGRVEDQNYACVFDFKIDPIEALSFRKGAFPFGEKEDIQQLFVKTDGQIAATTPEGRLLFAKTSLLTQDKVDYAAQSLENRSHPYHAGNYACDTSSAVIATAHLGGHNARIQKIGDYSHTSGSEIYYIDGEKNACNLRFCLEENGNGIQGILRESSLANLIENSKRRFLASVQENPTAPKPNVRRTPL